MSVVIEVQCLCTILNAFLAFGQYLVTNVGLLVISTGLSWLLFVCLRVLKARLVLSENLISLSVLVVLALG